jgi:F-type H+-transporting ATPase subunit gamma
MAHLKQIRRRLATVRTTHKMVSAMKLVAGARFRQAHDPVKRARAFEERLRLLLDRVSEETSPWEDHALFFQNNPESGNQGQELTVVITSDRGLCGSFHQQVIRETLAHVQQRESAPSRASMSFAWIGSKGRTGLRKQIAAPDVSWQEDLDRAPHNQKAAVLTRFLVTGFRQGCWHRVWLSWGSFLSGLSQKPVIRSCLPLVPSENRLEPSSGPLAVYTFEPEIPRMAEALVPRYVEAFVRRVLAEASMAEHAARMMAMDSASTNAEKLSKDLALVYNRTRQALITRELVEIVTGAEALSS